MSTRFLARTMVIASSLTFGVLASNNALSPQLKGLEPKSDSQYVPVLQYGVPIVSSEEEGQQLINDVETKLSNCSQEVIESVISAYDQILTRFWIQQNLKYRELNIGTLTLLEDKLFELIKELK